MGVPKAQRWGNSKNLGYWCEVLSTAGHAHCEVAHCTCPHHLPPERGEAYGEKRRAPRPHSYPRKDWKASLPPGYSEALRMGLPYTRYKAPAGR
jgi:hypothetical protein